MQRLCTNTDIQELLDNNDTEYDKNDLKWKRVIPEIYYPETTEKAQTYITYGISGDAVDRNRKVLSINFYIFCHKSLLRTKSGKRTTLIAAAIDREFNGTQKLANGVMELSSFDGNFSVGKDYYGYHIVYAVDDLNNPSNGAFRSYER